MSQITLSNLLAGVAMAIAFPTMVCATKRIEWEQQWASGTQVMQMQKIEYV